MPTNGKNGPGFHHVALRSSNIEATVRFYEEGLGFTRTYGWGEGDKEAVLLDTGDGNYIEVFAGGTHPQGQDVPGGALLHYAIRVPDTDAAYAQAMAAGARSQMEPKDVAIQGKPVADVRIAFVIGLDGEVIEFFQNEYL